MSATAELVARYADDAGCRRSPPADADLLVDVLQVLLDGARGDPQDRRNLGVRLPLADELDDLALARRQVGLQAGIGAALHFGELPPYGRVGLEPTEVRTKSLEHLAVTLRKVAGADSPKQAEEPITPRAGAQAKLEVAVQSDATEVVAIDRQLVIPPPADQVRDPNGGEVTRAVAVLEDRARVNDAPVRGLIVGRVRRDLSPGEKRVLSPIELGVRDHVAGHEILQLRKKLGRIRLLELERACGAEEVEDRLEVGPPKQGHGPEDTPNGE